MLYTFLVYTVFALACALAPNFESLVVFRCFTGIFAGSPIAVVGGINADIFINPIARGRSMALFMAVSSPNGECSLSKVSGDTNVRLGRLQLWGPL